MKIVLLFFALGFVNHDHSVADWRETTEDWTKFCRYLEESKTNFYKSTQLTIELGQKAYNLAQKWNDETNMAIAGLYIARGFEYSGKFEKCLELCFQSLRVFQKKNLKKDIAYTYDRIGYLYYYFSDSKLALKYFNKALKIYLEMENYPSYCLVLNHIGLAHQVNGDYEKADEIYRKAIDISIENKNSELLTALYHNLAILYLMQEKLNRAEHYYLKSMNYSNYEQEPINDAILFINLAGLYIKMKKYTRAETYLKKAEKIERESGAEYILHDIFYNYYLLYVGLNDDKKSLFYHKKYVEAENNLVSSDKRSKVDNIRTTFLLNEKNEEIKKLNISRENNDSKVLKYKIVMLVLSGSFVIFLIGLFYFAAKTNKTLKAIVFRKNKTFLLPGFNSKYSSSVLKNEEKEEIAGRIRFLFEKRKIFLKKNLTVIELSSELGISRTYTSQVINEIFQKTFTKLVNEYRIKEAGNLMGSEIHKLYTIESIANEVGFNSTNVFSKAFKEYYGLTPSSFIRQKVPDV